MSIERIIEKLREIVTSNFPGAKIKQSVTESPTTGGYTRETISITFTFTRFVSK